MLKSLVGGACIAVALLILQPLAASQDIGGTWLKATATAKVLAETIPEPDEPATVFGPKPKRLVYKSTFYLFIEPADTKDGLGAEYEMSVWLPVDGELEEVDTAFFALGPNTILTLLDIPLPITAKTNGEVEDLGVIYLGGNGRIKAKFDKEGLLKKLSFVSNGALAIGDVNVDGTVREVVGGAKIKARSIPESKVPPLAEI